MCSWLRSQTYQKRSKTELLAEQIELGVGNLSARNLTPGTNQVAGGWPLNLQRVDSRQLSSSSPLAAALTRISDLAARTVHATRCVETALTSA